MALTKATGIDGDLTFLAVHNGAFNRFQLTMGQNLIDTTAFGDDYEDFTGGVKGGSFMAKATTTYGATTTSPGFAALSAAGGSVIFTLAADCTVTVNCVVRDVTADVDHNNDNVLTFTGKTKGTPVEAWDTGT